MVINPCYGLILTQNEIDSFFKTSCFPDIQDEGELHGDVFRGGGWCVKVLRHDEGKCVRVTYHDGEGNPTALWYHPLREGLMLLSHPNAGSPTIQFASDDTVFNNAFYSTNTPERYEAELRQLGITIFFRSDKVPEEYSLSWYPNQGCCGVLMSDAPVEYEILGNGAIRYTATPDPHWTVAADHRISSSGSEYSVTLVADMPPCKKLLEDLRQCLIDYNMSSFSEMHDLWPAIALAEKKKQEQES